MFARTRYHVELHVHCQSCYNRVRFYWAVRAQYSNKIQVRLTYSPQDSQTSTTHTKPAIPTTTTDKDTDATEVPTSLSSHNRPQCDLEFDCLRTVCFESKQVGRFYSIKFFFPAETEYVFSLGKGWNSANTDMRRFNWLRPKNSFNDPFSLLIVSVSTRHAYYLHFRHFPLFRTNTSVTSTVDAASLSDLKISLRLSLKALMLERPWSYILCKYWSVNTDMWRLTLDGDAFWEMRR